MASKPLEVHHYFLNVLRVVSRFFFQEIFTYAGKLTQRRLFNKYYAYLTALAVTWWTSTLNTSNNGKNYSNFHNCENFSIFSHIEVLNYYAFADIIIIYWYSNLEAIKNTSFYFFSTHFWKHSCSRVNTFPIFCYELLHTI